MEQYQERGGLCILVTAADDCMASNLLSCRAKAGVIQAPLLLCMPAQLKDPNLAWHLNYSRVSETKSWRSSGRREWKDFSQGTLIHRAKGTACW